TSLNLSRVTLLPCVVSQSPPTALSTLSLHDALPISAVRASKCGDRRNFFLRQGEVEDLQVLPLPLRPRRLRQRDRTQLVVPAQDHLCRAPAVCGGDLLDHRLPQYRARPSQRAPRLGAHPVLDLPRTLLDLWKVRVQLHLVDRRHHTG